MGGSVWRCFPLVIYHLECPYVRVYSSLYRLNKEVSTVQVLVLSASLDNGPWKNESTESEKSKTVNYFENHIADNEDVIGVFLDIQAAFITIQPLGIKQALHNHNLDDKLVNWYYNFLTQRHLITEHNGVTYEGNIGIGFPQGWVCSAKFWTVAFNETINTID